MGYHLKPDTVTFLHDSVHAIPETAIAISDELYQELQLGRSLGQGIGIDASGTPYLLPLTAPGIAALCDAIDRAADLARAAVAGDPLRAVEYDRARLEAEQYAAAGYQGDVPPMVAAWAINGRTPQQAADSILAEAAQYTAALVQLRAVRLQAKEHIRALMDAGEVEQAQQLTEQTIAAIEAAVVGIGNNAG